MFLLLNSYLQITGLVLNCLHQVRKLIRFDSFSKNIFRIQTSGGFLSFFRGLFKIFYIIGGGSGFQKIILVLCYLSQIIFSDLVLLCDGVLLDLLKSLLIFNIVVDENGILIVSELLWCIVRVVVSRVGGSHVEEGASKTESILSIGDRVESQPNILVPRCPDQIVGSGGSEVLEDGVVVVDRRMILNERDDGEVVPARVWT